ncbi:MAG: hypothetical protein LBH59_10165 [Planctomycetaceae bacterium]|jgi:hypothetical protein|nr:hypothetical protein [Planctomycetaceae bacterium]
MINNCSSYLLTIRDSEIKLNSFPEYLLGFVHGIDERGECEMRWRGYRGHVYIVDKIRNIYLPLVFYDPTRLKQDIECDGYIYEVGLIVVKEVTKDIIVQTSMSLLESDYVQKNKWFSKEELSMHYSIHLFE